MIYANLAFENKLWTQGYKLVCGVDEVGKGCFAGPVVAGAVIFTPNSQIPEGIADSKLLTPKKREKLAEEIKQTALFYSVGTIAVEVINEVGIGKATQQAYLSALQKFDQFPEFLLIDAFFIDGIDRSIQQPIIGGDKLSVSIAAASIIAKVFRDNLMEKLHEQYPQYDFLSNKGYGTKVHRDAIGKYGLCEMHRKSFDLAKFLPR